MSLSRGRFPPLPFSTPPSKGSATIVPVYLLALSLADTMQSPPQHFLGRALPVRNECPESVVILHHPFWPNAGAQPWYARNANPQFLVYPVKVNQSFGAGEVAEAGTFGVPSKGLWKGGFAAQAGFIDKAEIVKGRGVLLFRRKGNPMDIGLPIPRQTKHAIVHDAKGVLCARVPTHRRGVIRSDRGTLLREAGTTAQSSINPCSAHCGSRVSRTLREALTVRKAV